MKRIVALILKPLHNRITFLARPAGKRSGGDVFKQIFHLFGRCSIYFYLFCCKITNSWFHLNLFLHVSCLSSMNNMNDMKCEGDLKIKILIFVYSCISNLHFGVFARQLSPHLFILASKTLPNAQQTQEIWVLWLVQHL